MVHGERLSRGCQEVVRCELWGVGCEVGGGCRVVELSGCQVVRLSGWCVCEFGGARGEVFEEFVGELACGKENDPGGDKDDLEIGEETKVVLIPDF